MPKWDNNESKWVKLIPSRDVGYPIYLQSSKLVQEEAQWGHTQKFLSSGLFLVSLPRTTRKVPRESYSHHLFILALLYPGLLTDEFWAVGGSTLWNFDALEAVWQKTHFRVYPRPTLVKLSYFYLFGNKQRSNCKYLAKNNLWVMKYDVFNKIFFPNFIM